MGDGMKKTRVDRAYPVQKVDASKRWPKWEAVEAAPGSIWGKMMGVKINVLYCVIRHRDPHTGEILNRATLAAGPLATMGEAEALVRQYNEKGEP